MRISIITATYNSAATVGDTLSSIASQDYPDIEHLIVDGLSRDNTLDIVKQFPHVSSVVTEKDKGIYDAMNKGIARAGGEVIGILNSDDLYTHNGVISKVMKAFEDPGVDAVYGDLQYVDQHRITKVVRTWRSGTFTTNSFYQGWMPPHPAFFVRRRLYENFGNFRLDLKTAADYEIMLRFLLREKAKAAYIPEILVLMRTGGASNASLKQRLRANREDARAWEVNGLKPRPWTLIVKPLRKIGQFIFR